MRVGVSRELLAQSEDLSLGAGGGWRKALRIVRARPRVQAHVHPLPPCTCVALLVQRMGQAAARGARRAWRWVGEHAAQQATHALVIRNFANCVACSAGQRALPHCVSIARAEAWGGGLDLAAERKQAQWAGVRAPLLAHAGTEACKCLVCSPLPARVRPVPPGLAPGWGEAVFGDAGTTVGPRARLSACRGACPKSGSFASLASLCRYRCGTRPDCLLVSWRLLSELSELLEAGEASRGGRAFGEGSICSAARALAALRGVPTHRAPCSSIARLGSPALESRHVPQGRCASRPCCAWAVNLLFRYNGLAACNEGGNAMISIAKAEMSTCSHLKSHTHAPATCPC